MRLQKKSKYWIDEDHYKEQSKLSKWFYNLPFEFRMFLAGALFLLIVFSTALVFSSLFSFI